MSRSRQLRRAGLAALAAGVLGTTAACSGGSAPAPTVKVDRGTVATSVSASGTLVAISEQNLGFSDRGKLAEMMVKVGDHVEAGQPLARLDDAALTQALNSAKAKLDQQTASLGKITGGNSVEKAQASLDSARAILDATKDSVDATNSADASAADRAKVQLDFDEKMLDRAKECPPTPATNQQQAPTAPNPGASGGPGSTGSTRSTGSSGSSPSTAPTRSPSILEGSSDGGQDTGMAEPRTAAVQPVAFSVPMTSAACQTSIDSAQRQVILSQTAYDAARHRQETDAAQGRISVENARKAVVDAQSTLDGAQRDKPADTAVQDALVRDAKIAVDGAQRNLDAATLKAPIAGTVSAVNGAVGEFVPAAGGATTQAPGSTARIPGAASAASSGSAGASAAGGAGGALITLSGLDTFQLVVPFEESDAAKVSPNQPVQVSVDAVAGLTKPGTVVSVAPTANSINGVTSYYTTIVLNESDPRLKDGQTAQADVLTRSIDNALRVPSAAVRQNGGQSVVNIPGPDGTPVPTPFTPGLVGNQFTEVTGGLSEGQDVLLPQATVTATQGGGGPRQGG